MRNILRFGWPLLIGVPACVPLGPGSPLCPNVPLNQATGTIVITQESGAAQAGAQVSLRNGSCIQTLEGGQEIAINDRLLTFPDSNGDYTVSVGPDDGVFTVLVNEPMRGVSKTDIEAPGAFEVTSPAAGGAFSLSGTTFTWTNADAALDVRIAIQQNLFGQIRSREYGPFDDAGSMSLSVTDLSAFQQGADLSITVTRTRKVNAINGLKAGTLSVHVTRTFTVVPAP